MARLKLTPPQQKISELILHTPAPGKHCARNAIFHVERAWEIRHIDPEMAVFRAITGEEEAATAIFHSLKRHRYKGADKLDPRSHIQKAALFPFFQAVSTIAESTRFWDPMIVLSKDGTRFRLRLTVPNANVKAAYAFPEPPLEFSLQKENGDPYEFRDELKQVHTTKNIKTISKYVQQLANMRNRILYATTQGKPNVEKPIDRFLQRRRDRIFQFLLVYLLVDPYKNHQLFVQQTLTVFMNMVRGLLDQELDS